MATDSAHQAFQPSAEQQNGSLEPGLVLDVLVEQPGSTCNLYQPDRERNGVRLERVLSVETPLPADLARAPLERPQNALDRFSERMQGRSADSSEQPTLPVLLLTSASVAPDVWVAARLIGALRVAGNAATAESIIQGWALLAVPDADAQQASLQRIADLPPERRAALAAWIASQGVYQAEGAQPTHAAQVEWAEAQEAAALVRQARAAWRQTQRQRVAQARPQGPREHLRLGRRSDEEALRVAWRAIAGVSIQQLREQGLGAYAEAEHLLRLVPQRFQQYLSELLLDDERVLCFIERPRLRRRRGVLGLGARYLNEGLLLCTDRQVLWMRDVAAPDATLVPWGYVARACPVERLAGAEIVPAGQASTSLALDASPWPRLVVQSAAAQGTARLVLEFPKSALPALQQATTLLERFLPWPGGSLQAVSDRRVRRLPSVSAWEPRADERDLLLQLGGMTPPEARERLHASLAAALAPGEQALAQALAPALAGYSGGPRLLAVTPERLLIGQTGETRRGGGQPQTTMTAVTLARVAAVQLRHSLLGCAFEAIVPEPPGQHTRHFIPFNSPAIVPFRAIYTRARLLIAGSYQGQKQPLPASGGEA